jgi:hypothetical protein
LWQIDGDEDSLRPVERDFKISGFHGEKPIKVLIMFPFKYLVKNEEVTRNLTDRGRPFVKLRHRTWMYYDGNDDQFLRVAACMALLRDRCRLILGCKLFTALLILRRRRGRKTARARLQ